MLNHGRNESIALKHMVFTKNITGYFNYQTTCANSEYQASLQEREGLGNEVILQRPVLIVQWSLTESMKSYAISTYMRAGEHPLTII